METTKDITNGEICFLDKGIDHYPETIVNYTDNTKYDKTFGNIETEEYINIEGFFDITKKTNITKNMSIIDSNSAFNVISVAYN
ncbi:uncharacterized protein VNE69_06012 [Vairimorpha necatrix]|uniref:Uncharacterized protein n=1 Tax=Vairimorpha necatrix TaxID=6039 RepID=A0AAX4JCV8_9MICR